MAEERGMLGKVWDYMKERVLPEVGEMLEKKTIQGAAEISQALNHESPAYVPYGEGQRSLDVEGPQQSYQDTLREASQRAAPAQSQQLEL